MLEFLRDALTPADVEEEPFDYQSPSRPSRIGATNRTKRDEGRDEQAAATQTKRDEQAAVVAEDDRVRTLRPQYDDTGRIRAIRSDDGEVHQLQRPADFRKEVIEVDKEGRPRVMVGNVDGTEVRLEVVQRDDQGRMIKARRTESGKTIEFKVASRDDLGRIEKFQTEEIKPKGK